MSAIDTIFQALLLLAGSARHALGIFLMIMGAFGVEYFDRRRWR